MIPLFMPNIVGNAEIESAVAQATGTAIGDMTAGGALAACFDSTQHQDTVSSARSVSDNIVGQVGKDWGVGVTKVLSKVIAYSSTDGAFHQSPHTTTITVKGSNVSSTGPWDDLDSITFTSANSQAITLRDMIRLAYRFHIIEISAAGAAETTTCSEVEFTEVT